MKKCNNIFLKSIISSSIVIGFTTVATEAQAFRISTNRWANNPVLNPSATYPEVIDFLQQFGITYTSSGQPVQYSDFNNVGESATVSYSFANTSIGSLLPFNNLNPASGLSDNDLKNAVRKAFDVWEYNVQGLTFVEASQTNYNHINVGSGTFDGRYLGGGITYTNTLASGSFPSPFSTPKIKFDLHEIWDIGAVKYDGDEHNQTGFAGYEFDIFMVALHEIGHAIGLAHNYGNTVLNPNYFVFDNFINYTQLSNLNASMNILTLDDIDGGKFIYGNFNPNNIDGYGGSSGYQGMGSPATASLVDHDHDHDHDGDLDVSAITSVPESNPTIPLLGLGLIALAAKLKAKKSSLQ